MKAKTKPSFGMDNFELCGPKVMQNCKDSLETIQRVKPKIQRIVESDGQEKWREMSTWVMWMRNER